jgi:cytochrome c peroxidase
MIRTRTMGGELCYSMSVPTARKIWTTRYYRHHTNQLDWYWCSTQT